MRATNEGARKSDGAVSHVSSQCFAGVKNNIKIIWGVMYPMLNSPVRTADQNPNRDTNFLSILAIDAASRYMPYRLF
jgi:hypothetical protein